MYIQIISQINSNQQMTKIHLKKSYYQIKILQD